MLCLTGLNIPGGMASVNRAISTVFDRQFAAERMRRVDRVLLLADRGVAKRDELQGSVRGASGRKWRFVMDAWQLALRHRHELTLFDLVGLARAATLPLPGFPPGRLAVFTHFYELSLPMTPRHRTALHRADYLLANSHFSANELRQWIPERADRVRAVPLCIDPARLAEWESLGNTESRPRGPAALIVSRLSAVERGKGHDALISAWPGVLADHPEAVLWIVGDGNNRPRLEQSVRTLGIAASVRFWGTLDTATLHELYSRASLYVMPSCQEGFGIVYAEAMWHALPCIGSTADAAGEVIIEGDTGLLVDYDNPEETGAAIRRLLGDPSLARRMGQAGKARVLAEYTFEAFRVRLLDALELRA